ncbi:DGQHR domain-containing protein, partial [Haliangium sp. UPWRP_2]|uniref:DGQHR domain-containing protein n=1 Tax=Haliangium sp. UPWRP_2 TaxID=1931276 RepID=UPI0011B267BE
RRSENPTEGFQRRLSESRADELAEYLNTEANSIPINIVLSAQPDAEFTYIRENKAVSFKRVAGAFIILDGQHRMWGYRKCSARHRVPVAIYEGLARPDEARLFVDINTKHQGVPKALILDVKGLAGSESEDEQLLRELFDKLNT